MNSPFFSNVRITPKNLIRHELIGLRIKVAESSDPTLVGLEGRVVDETKNTLVIETEEGFKRILKKIARFRFKLPSGEIVEIEGRILVGRPEERIRKKVRRW